MGHFTRRTRHFDRCTRPVSIAALASLIWGCSGNTNNFAGAAGSPGAGAAGSQGSCVAGPAGQGGGGIAGTVAGGGGQGGATSGGAGSGGAGANIALCAAPPGYGYDAFQVCRPDRQVTSFTYDASGVLLSVSEPHAEYGGCTYPGWRRLTVKPPAGAATFVDIYAVDDADLSAWLLPLVGTTVSIRATYNDSLGHLWQSFLVSDGRGPLIYVVNSSSCPAAAYANTPPPALSWLTVERGAELCLDANQTRGNAESRFVTDCGALTLAPTESGHITSGGYAYDVRAHACAFQGPKFAGGDGYDHGAWTLRRLD
jgi:hypothetical protein